MSRILIGSLNFNKGGQPDSFSIRKCNHGNMLLQTHRNVAKMNTFFLYTEA